MDERERLMLQQRAIEALKERIAKESYLSIADVQKRLGLSRSVVESLKMEILPYVDYGRGTRMHRRYHPADVLAADARIRAWRAAQAEGRGEEYLRKLREQLEETDRTAIATALDTRRSA